MANIIDESSQGRKEAQADETKTGKWSWKTWLFYIVCILAIAVATSVASSAEARDWRGGALGTGDAFYNYNSNDFRWVDYHTNRARIREGSAWMLEVRSRDFMPEASWRINNLSRGVGINLGKVTFETGPDGIMVSKQCFGRNPGSAGDVFGDTTVWISSRNKRAATADGVPGGNYVYRVYRVDSCFVPQGRPRTQRPVPPEIKPVPPVSPPASVRNCPTWGEVNAIWQQNDAAFNGLKLFAHNGKIYYAFGHGTGTNSEATGMYYQVGNGWEVRNCQTGVEKRFELAPSPNPVSSANGQWTIWKLKNAGTMWIRNNMR